MVGRPWQGGYTFLSRLGQDDAGETRSATDREVRKSLRPGGRWERTPQPNKLGVFPQQEHQARQAGQPPCSLGRPGGPAGATGVASLHGTVPKPKSRHSLGATKRGKMQKNPKPKPRRGYLPHEVTERSKGLSFKLERMKSRQKKKRELMLVRMLGSWRLPPGPDRMGVEAACLRPASF